MDIKTAFLYGQIDRELYITMPEGFHEYIGVPKHFSLKLKKPIYGLKLAPRFWHELLAGVLRDFGLTRLFADPCLSFKYNQDGRFALMVLFHVDDLIIAGISMPEIDVLKTTLKLRFQMDDIGRLDFCLGIRVERIAPDQLHLHQRKYIEEVLDRCYHFSTLYGNALQISVGLRYPDYAI